MVKPQLVIVKSFMKIRALKVSISDARFQPIKQKYHEDITFLLESQAAVYFQRWPFDNPPFFWTLRLGDALLKISLQIIIESTTHLISRGKNPTNSEFNPLKLERNKPAKKLAYHERPTTSMCMAQIEVVLDTCQGHFKLGISL